VLHVAHSVTDSVAHVAIALLAASGDAAANELTALKAAVLGIVEGITEFLPISSTGHLLITATFLDIGQDPATKDAADTYTITIQAGAILAVVVLYWQRLRDMAFGAVGRDPGGRRLFGATVVAFVPAAIVAVLFESAIKDRLFGVWPVIVAWVVGGVVTIVFSRALHERGRSGTELEALTLRTALVIGVAQCIALWPGTSRSLVTIIAALAVGLSMQAAVEFSFLLGLLTLGAATAYEAVQHGGELVDTFGLLNPVIGFVAAFVTAVIAIRWMVSYLQRHSLELFGWYRIVVAGIALVLLALGVL
jgi:undecaprenyl-diphosphatase